MKRSEAERKIDGWLDNATIITGETIIAFLEHEIGMLPPMLPISEYQFQAEHKWQAE